MSWDASGFESANGGSGRGGAGGRRSDPTRHGFEDSFEDHGGGGRESPPSTPPYLHHYRQMGEGGTGRRHEAENDYDYDNGDGDGDCDVDGAAPSGSFYEEGGDLSFGAVMEGGYDESFADYGHDYGGDGVEEDYTHEDSPPMKRKERDENDDHTPRTYPQGHSTDEYDFADDYAAGAAVGYVDGGGDAYEPEAARSSSQSYYRQQQSHHQKQNSHQQFDDDPSLPPGVTKRDRDENNEAMMRLMAARLGRADWADKSIYGGADGAESLERRLRDFNFAQNKRRERYGDERPWGIMGLYDHLQGIRTDVEWAEDAAWRREHGEPYLSWADFDQGRKLGLNRPFFTYLMIIFCTAMLIVSYGVNGWKVEPLSVNPMYGPSAATLTKLGAKYTPLIVENGDWFRLFTPMVLHAGLIHYLLNMVALYFIGSAVEISHGFIAAAIIFIMPATGGTILSALFLPEYISVGASGGIFGLIGACIADICMNWSLLFSRQVNQTDSGTRLRHARVLVWLLADILVNCIIGLTPFVDNFTHMGGMVYGFLCGLSAMERLPLNFFGVATDGCSRFRNGLVRFFGLILSVLLIMVSTALLVDSDGGSSPCNTCRYVSCVPFPPWAGEEDKWWYCDDCHKATADAIQNESTGYYDLMSLRCPNGEISDVDLSGERISDREYLRDQLTTYCRHYCESVFV